MADTVYNNGKESIMNGDVDLLTETVNVLLLDDAGTYTVNPDDNFVADLGANELSGTGYSRKTLGTKTVTQDNTNNRAEFDAANVTWAGINAGTVQAAVIFVQKTGDSDSILIAYIDSGGFPITTNGGDLTIQWNAEGIVQLT